MGRDTEGIAGMMRQVGGVAIDVAVRHKIEAALVGHQGVRVTLEREEGCQDPTPRTRGWSMITVSFELPDGMQPDLEYDHSNDVVVGGEGPQYLPHLARLFAAAVEEADRRGWLTPCQDGHQVEIGEEVGEVANA